MAYLANSTLPSLCATANDAVLPPAEILSSSTTRSYPFCSSAVALNFSGPDAHPSAWPAM